MKVELLRTTPDALDLLLSTKNTRLKHESDPSEWPYEEKIDHLLYMRDTIKSSWEFVDYVFRISGVSRMFTHQLVRTRTGAYAQESRRAIDASGDLAVDLPFIHPESKEEYDEAIRISKEFYNLMIHRGEQRQVARGVLTESLETSIIAKFNLRTLHDMAKVRMCVRAQSEYQDVFRAMREEVLRVHPWVETAGFIEVACISEGVCAFPRWGCENCPVYHPSMDRSRAKEIAKERFWSTRFEANPESTEGKSK